jgi:hypothetical protein
VQNCAQIDRKCTLFRPKTPFFAHFCRGEGRLFGRPKIGVLGVPGVARAAPPKTGFLLRKNLPDGSDGRIATLSTERKEINKFLSASKCVTHALLATAKWRFGHNRHSELAERTESCSLNLFFSFL